VVNSNPVDTYQETDQCHEQHSASRIFLQIEYVAGVKKAKKIVVRRLVKKQGEKGGERKPTRRPTEQRRGTGSYL